MRRRTGNMIVVGTIMLCAAAGALSGCGPEPVEYDTQGTPQEGASQIMEENREWVTKVVPSHGNGEEDSVISINVTMLTQFFPEEMYVVEIEKLEFDEDYKRQVLRAFFGSNEIYYYDEEHTPRERLEELIARQQETVANQQSWIAGYEPGTMPEWRIEELEKEQEKLYRLEELLATAPEEPIPAEDYSAQEYMGYVNGIPFDAQFVDSVNNGDYGRMKLKIAPLDYRDLAPEEMKKMDEVWPSFIGSATMDENELVHEGDEGNQAKLSLAEALQKGKEFVELMGMGDTFCKGGHTAGWSGESKEGAVNTKEYGYYIEFDWGIENKSFGDYDLLWEYAESNQMTHTGCSWDFTLQLSLLVTDEGIVEAEIINPIRIMKQTQAVSCLSIEQVQKIMNNELASNPDCIRLKEEPMLYRFMRFNYFPVPSEEEENIYSYVPVWVLSGGDADQTLKNAVIVNALDGTIIDWTAGLVVEEYADNAR